jgi:hypothetical protein
MMALSLVLVSKLDLCHAGFCFGACQNTLAVLRGHIRD